MKKNILFMFIGMFIMSIISIGVYAINANQITYKNTTVEQAIDDLYSSIDGIQFESLGGRISPNTTAATYDYTSDFKGKILAVMTHYTTDVLSTVTVDSENVEVLINYQEYPTNEDRNYPRNIEYSIFDVEPGQNVTCTTRSITRTTPAWGYASCSLYRIR